jgi:hypothetical protein
MEGGTTIERICVFPMPPTATISKSKGKAPSTTLAPTAPALVNYEDRLLSRAHTAAWLGVTPDCMGVWARRTPPCGPRALRVGKFKVRYRIRDILDWLDSQSDAPAIPCKRRRQRAAERTSA